MIPVVDINLKRLFTFSGRHRTISYPGAVYLAGVITDPLNW